MKYTILVLTIFITFSCVNTPDTMDTFKVGYDGVLKNMMHKGDISAQANLKDFQNTSHLYALGAVEQLKGEILILNGKAYISSVQDQMLKIDRSFDYQATLFVYTTVDKWTTSTIPDQVISYPDLEKHIEQLAIEQGIEPNKPFPFLIEGTAKSFDWHVINWKDGDTEHSHEKHKKSGLYGTVTDQAVDMLGFYSKQHHAIFTHHTTNMHLHVKTKDDNLSGHLDDLTLGKGMIIKLPDIK